ncbi:hypothetical protein SBD_1516 [Streptomyces bottropensis ATCC 25435]|uniref:Uncharacterized protein n=1 Tax=Streptomyces bottropensis ATCC 25435 TaxID=1054862 RepID=M3FVF9_9ACTN|nr:hypothetical protein SBD_1516 [Streptomyces bottropensis ATCC 25435]
MLFLPAPAPRSITHARTGRPQPIRAGPPRGQGGRHVQRRHERRDEPEASRRHHPRHGRLRDGGTRLRINTPDIALGDSSTPAGVHVQMTPGPVKRTRLDDALDVDRRRPAPNRRSLTGT